MGPLCDSCQEWHNCDGGTEQAAGPRAGANVLTELRLDEFKRLIDRDAKA